MVILCSLNVGSRLLLGQDEHPVYEDELRNAREILSLHPLLGQDFLATSIQICRFGSRAGPQPGDSSQARALVKVLRFQGHSGAPLKTETSSETCPRKVQWEAPLAGLVAAPGILVEYSPQPARVHMQSRGTFTVSMFASA